MRVLHLISSGGMYGAEAVILNLSEELNCSGAHQSVLGVFAHPDQPVPKVYEIARQRGIEAHLVCCRGQADVSVPGSFRSLAERVGADVVHTHGYKADIYAAVAWRGRRPGLVSTCHTWYDNDLALRLYGAADRWMLRRFDGVVAVSDDVRGRLLAAHVRGDRIQLIQNGVAVEPFVTAGEKRTRKPGLNGSVRLGLVGRLAPEKGIDLFLTAAHQLIQRYPEARFSIAGDGPDGEALKQQAKQLGITENVSFLGRQEDMPDFYAGIDILVSSSRQEGLPVALLEGMASALPVVATRVGAVPEAVADGWTGVLVAPDDPTALADGIAPLLRDPGLRARMGQAGQQRIVEEFSAARMTEEYLALYAGVLQRRAGLADLRTCPS